MTTTPADGYYYYGDVRRRCCNICDDLSEPSDAATILPQVHFGSNR